jgi:hypothetical protein
MLYSPSPWSLQLTMNASLYFQLSYLLLSPVLFLECSFFLCQVFICITNETRLPRVGTKVDIVTPSVLSWAHWLLCLYSAGDRRPTVPASDGNIRGNYLCRNKLLIAFYIYIGYKVVPPYPRVIRSKNYRGYVKPRILPKAIQAKDEACCLCVMTSRQLSSF